MQILKPLTVYIPDTRGVKLSSYGLGNLKIGPGVHTYSRLPGRPWKKSLGLHGAEPLKCEVEPVVEKPLRQGESHPGWVGTCPGSTEECESICYATRPVTELGPVATMWLRNTIDNIVPAIPEETKILRIHISGDFDRPEYIESWIARLSERPDVACWVYTRSWRVPELLASLERLRALPNVQMFASMDASCVDLPPTGWRRAWIHRTAEKAVKTGWGMETRLKFFKGRDEVDASVGYDAVAMGALRGVAFDSTPGLICPEETGRKQNCVECGYCIKGQKYDVIFLEH